MKSYNQLRIILKYQLYVYNTQRKRKISYSTFEFLGTDIPYVSCNRDNSLVDLPNFE